MKTKMIDILNKYADANMFSLTSSIVGCKITKKEYQNALDKMKIKTKSYLEDIYNRNKIKDYSSFEELYSKIEKECQEFNSEENKNKYLKEVFDKKYVSDYKKLGMSDAQIEEIRNDFFCCSFIADKVETKYFPFYTEIGMLFDRENDMKNFRFDNGKDPIENIKEELRKDIIKYEMSFYNAVTISSELMINYYFALNDETKKYLFDFESDFDLKDLQDLALYKDDKLLFYSCTHEGYNSLDE